MPDQTLALVQGDSPTYRFETRDTADDPLNLADFEIFFFIKRSLQDPDDAAEFAGAEGSGVAIPFSESDGVIDVTIPADVSQNLRVGRAYPAYLRLVNEFDSEDVRTPWRGDILVTFSE